MIGATVPNVTGPDKMFGEWSQIIAGHLCSATPTARRPSSDTVGALQRGRPGGSETTFRFSTRSMAMSWNAISLYPPRAVFIDFAFGDEARPDDSRPELLAGVDALTCRGAAADCHQSTFSLRW